MKRMRLIDLIPEQSDRVPVPADWNWLMQPFVFAFHLPAEVAASETYVEVESGAPSLDYLSTRIEATLSLGVTAESLRHNFRVLSLYPGRPILLVGEPGVGKTTWLLHFFSQAAVERRSYYVRVDGSSIYPALGGVTPVDYLQFRIRQGIWERMKATADSLGIEVPAHSVTPHLENMFVLESALKETAEILAQNKKTCWVLIDNFDRRPRELQQLAIEFGKNLCAALGVHVIVALRPYTLGHDHIMDDLPCITVPSPSLGDLVKSRINYVLDSSNCRELKKQFAKGVSANLRWTNGTIKSEEDLGNLWRTVGNTLAELHDLQRLLFVIHLGDLHAITEDLRGLMFSGFFCNEMMRRLAGDSRNVHEFLTAYFRGAYRHHRHSKQSGEYVVNLYEAPGADDRHRFLLIRFLQVVRKLGAGNAIPTYGDARGVLESFGYESHRIDAAASLLIRCRLVLEVKRLLDWHNPVLELANSDQITVSESGVYYLDKLTRNPRYIQAMADVTFLPSEVVETMKTDERSVDDAYCNAFLLMSNVEKSLSAENSRLIKTGVFGHFLSMLDIGEGFFYSGVWECHKQFKALVNQRKASPNILEKWERLLRRAEEIRSLRLEYSV